MVKIYILIASFFLSTISLEAYTEKEVQNIIKQNEIVHQIDSELNVVYSILKDFSTPEQKDILTREQRKWLKERNQAVTEEELSTVYKKRVEKLKTRIREDEKPFLEKIITGRPTIDKVKAEALLKKCPTLACQAYAIYFESQKFPRDEEKKKIIEMKLLKLLSKVSPSYRYEAPEDLKFGGDSLLENLLVYSEVVVPSDVEAYPVLTVPLWLVLEHPEILDYDTGTCYNPYGVRVIAEDRIENFPSYGSFNNSLDALFVGNWDEGTFYKPFYSSQSRMRDFLSFAPEKIELSENEKPAPHFSLVNDSLERWSFLGYWNFIKYNEFKIAFEKMARELKTYYESHDFLKKYAPYATNYLNAYVHFNYSSTEIASEKAYQVFRKPHQSLEDLKKSVMDFSQADWNAALSYAILNNYGTDVLEWLIQSGANVNAKVDDESALIKASNRPEILSFLISKGANLEEKTGFGKTALFYAIQFNNFESVKVLVENGANLNASLIKEEDKGKEGEYFELKKVLGFSPLAYCIRYGSENLTKYLLEKGASLKGISVEAVRDWMQSNAYFFEVDIINTRFEANKSIVESHKKL
jgi:hypothetical protein